MKAQSCTGDTLTCHSHASTTYADEPRLIRLENRTGMQITLMDWGATWLSCQVPLASGERREVLLGCAQPEAYRHQQAYLGAMVGRYANRIAAGHLPHPEGDRQLATNQAGNLLHGGPHGFDKRRWQVLEQSAQQVRFGLHSADGDQGFPGNLDVEVIYRLDEDNSVSIEMRARTDALTPVNLTNHAYFNLDGTQSDVRQHTLRLRADFMVPTDGHGIPLGPLALVDGTSFNFNQPKRLAADFLADEQQQGAKGYDHSYLLDRTLGSDNQTAAELISADGQLSLRLSTSLPGLQLYTGNYLAGNPSREGGDYADYAGVALEPQFLPDSPHHPEWPQPSCWLEPGKLFRHHIRYQFV
jgi:aldose 1-epimerase